MIEYKEYKKVATVKAIQMAVPFEVETLEGVMEGNAGDYLCMGIEGEQWPVKKEIFEKTYELIDKKPMNPQAGQRYEDTPNITKEDLEKLPTGGVHKAWNSR